MKGTHFSSATEHYDSEFRGSFVLLSEPAHQNIVTHPVFKTVFIFNWKIISLQYYVGFCHTSTWISRHRYIHVPSACTSLPPSTLSHSSMLSQSTKLRSLCYKQLPTSYLFHTIFYKYLNAILSICPTLFFPWCVHKSVLYVWVSIPAL